MNRLSCKTEACAENPPDGKPSRRVAVLFSGGDAPGMNSLLRFFVRLGLHQHRAEVLGVKDGYAGLVRLAKRACGSRDRATIRRQIDNCSGTAGLFDRRLEILKLDHVTVSGLSCKGGIVLGAARCPEFLSVGTRAQVVRLLRDLKVDSLVTVGGNGTLAGAQDLAEESGMHVLGVSATVDNDIDITETSLGFDTAVNNTMRAIETLNDTAGSHHRIIVAQTMGRDSGNLARSAGLAAGAEIIVIPERGPLTSEKTKGIASRLERSFRRGQTHAIVVIAEGVKSELGGACPSAQLRAMLRLHFEEAGSPMASIEIREVVLGHVVRGGEPTAADRLLASQLATTAWDAIMRTPPESGLAVVRGGRVEVVPFGTAQPAEWSELAESEYCAHKAVSAWE